MSTICTVPTLPDCGAPTTCRLYPFGAVMYIVSSEARSGLPFELLYTADDLVLIAPTMEQLCRRVAEWRVGLLHKGLKLNAGKSKVVVGRSGGWYKRWEDDCTLESGPEVCVVTCRG